MCGGVDAGTAHSQKSCYEQSLHHQPGIASAWYNLRFDGGGVVAGTAYSQESCYEQSLHRQPGIASAWYNL